MQAESYYSSDIASARITTKVMGEPENMASDSEPKNFFSGPPKGSPNIAKKYTLLLQTMLSLLTYYLIHSKWYGAITEHAGGHTQNTVNMPIVTVS